MSSSPTPVVAAMVESVSEDRQLAKRLLELAQLPDSRDPNASPTLETPFQAFEAFERWR